MKLNGFSGKIPGWGIWAKFGPTFLVHINDFSEKKFCMGQVGYFGSKLGRLYNSGWDLGILLYILHNGWGQEACKWFSEIFFFNLMRLYIWLMFSWTILIFILLIWGINKLFHMSLGWLFSNYVLTYQIFKSKFSEYGNGKFSFL